jgi:uncharacterized membrane protein
MNLRFHIIFVVCVLTLTGHVTATEDNTATVHGSTYRWDTIEPLDSTVVDINSTPPQSMVAKRGEYSFELGPGVYNITARYYQNGALAYFTEETFEIKEGGNYVYDLLLQPASEANKSSVSYNNTSENSSSNNAVPMMETPTAENPTRNNSNGTTIPDKISTYPSTYLLGFFVLFFLLAGGYGIFRNHKTTEKNTLQKEKTRNKAGGFFKFIKIKELSTKALGRNVDSEIGPESRANAEGIVSASLEKPASSTSAVKELPAKSEPSYESKKTYLKDSTEYPESENSASKKKLLLSADLQEVVGLIRGNGGRITQKDLRSRLKYSEVKVSLLLSELEKRDLIKKLKRGRENIVVLKDENL